MERTRDKTAVGQIVDVTITGLSHDGRGIGRLDSGQVVFVPGLLPGERAQVALTHHSRRNVIAACQERLLDSPERRRPACILADRCGGCSLQHLNYNAQLVSKHNQVAQALARIGQLSLEPEAVYGCSDELGYRNRTVIPLERSGNGPLRAGFYRVGTHRIVNMNHCPVLDPRLDALIAPIKSDLDHAGWPIDCDLKAGGGLRHLALRIGANSGEILITLVSSHTNLDGLQGLAERWLSQWPQVVGVVLNLQPLPSNTIFGAHSHRIAGREWLREQFGGLSFHLGCDTFFQVNTAQAERVIPLLLGELQPSGLQVIDAYCGVGAFSLPLAAAGHRVHGLELHSGAVELARFNAQLNRLEAAVTFQQGPVAEHLAAVLPDADAVLLDPPRKGLDGAVRSALIQHPVPRLLYLSCDPATLARDLGSLTAGPYSLKRVQPIDFFPNTSHVECLAVLSS